MHAVIKDVNRRGSTLNRRVRIRLMCEVPAVHPRLLVSDIMHGDVNPENEGTQGDSAAAVPAAPLVASPLAAFATAGSVGPSPKIANGSVKGPPSLGKSVA